MRFPSSDGANKMGLNFGLSETVGERIGDKVAFSVFKCTAII